MWNLRKRCGQQQHWPAARSSPSPASAWPRIPARTSTDTATCCPGQAPCRTTNQSAVILQQGWKRSEQVIRHVSVPPAHGSITPHSCMSWLTVRKYTSAQVQYEVCSICSWKYDDIWPSGENTSSLHQSILFNYTVYTERCMSASFRFVRSQRGRREVTVRSEWSQRGHCELWWQNFHFNSRFLISWEVSLTRWRDDRKPDGTKTTQNVKPAASSSSFSSPSEVEEWHADFAQLLWSFPLLVGVWGATGILIQQPEQSQTQDGLQGQDRYRYRETDPETQEYRVKGEEKRRELWPLTSLYGSYFSLEISKNTHQNKKKKKQPDKLSHPSYLQKHLKQRTNFLIQKLSTGAWLVYPTQDIVNKQVWQRFIVFKLCF